MEISSNILFLKKIPDIGIESLISEESQQKSKKRKTHFLCKFCRTKITSSKYKIKVKGKFRHICANPHGIIFEIGCFSQGQNYITTNKPTKEFTWFPGYSWQILVCVLCSNHLGWLYTSHHNSFLGLILDNLIEE